jgi:hypothetical protein
MLYACYAAGTSGSDTTDIGLTEAQYRVARFSEPFLDLGIAGYYANWFGNAFEKFLTYLFAGKTLGQAYESYFDFNAATVSRTTHPTTHRLRCGSTRTIGAGIGSITTLS